MNDTTDNLAIALFGEIFMSDQLARNRLSKALPKGMELSHFSVLNHLTSVNAELNLISSLQFVPSVL